MALGGSRIPMQLGTSFEVFFYRRIWALPIPFSGIVELSFSGDRIIPAVIASAVADMPHGTIRRASYRSMSQCSFLRTGGQRRTEPDLM